MEGEGRLCRRIVLLREGARKRAEALEARLLGLGRIELGFGGWKER